jgi:hypothetical protein
MSHSITPSIPLDRNPSFRPGLDALSLWLAEHDYPMPAIDRILSHTAAEGTPTGSPDLDPGDEAGATEAFVDALEPVAGDHPAWDDPAAHLDAESILEAAGGLDDADRSVPADAILMPPELDDLEMEPGP